MRSPIDHWSFALRIIAAVAAIGLINSLLLPWESSLELMREGGPVENTTVIVFYIALAVLWTFTPLELPRLSCAAISILLLACAARELDMHIALFGMSILKSNFYRKFATGQQIAVALLIIFPVLLSVVYLLIRHGRWLLNGVRQRVPTAVTTMSIIGLLVFVKLLDRALGVVEELGGQAPPIALRAMQLSLEEPLETVLALLVMVAIAQAWRTADR